MSKGQINPWLENVLDQISQRDKVTLVRDLSPSLPEVNFDSDKLRRVVINLVENALQAVTARLETEKSLIYRPVVKVSTLSEGDCLVIEVEDNGTGMDQQTAARSFDPLFTTRPRGTGLGLAIVRKIVDEHGGHVSMKSQPYRGTTLTVSIPV